MTDDSTDLPQHTHVVIRHPDGKTTRIIKTSSTGSERPLTTDEELLLAMLAALKDKDSEIAALREAVEAVCEGWTMPHNARKVLESALWPAQAVQPKHVPETNFGNTALR